jgi:hypothetical protein
MNKFVFTILLCSLNLFAFGQIKVGSELGLQLTNFTNKITQNGNTTTRSGDLKPSFRAGLIIDLLMINSLSIQPGLFYSLNNLQESSPVKLTDGVYDSKSRLTIHTVQLPVYLMYKTSLEGKGRFFIGAGGYLSYALAGRHYSEIPIEIVDSTRPTNFKTEFLKSKRNIKLGNNKTLDDYKPIGYGLLGCVGYETPVGLYVRGQFMKGLANVRPNGNSNNINTNWQFGISVGLFFGDGGGGFDW